MSANPVCKLPSTSASSNKGATGGLRFYLSSSDESHNADDTSTPETPLTPKSLQKFGVSLTRGGPRTSEETQARVLVLYTGGTIGMRVNTSGVYIPEAHFLEKELRKMTIFHDTEYEDQITSSHPAHPPHRLKPLYLPLSKSGIRVEYCVHEYEPLLDSSNMSMEDWAKIAADIEFTYEYFNGFVILHGTDTMSYTASALSFMMENLGKPIILTGSQIPIFEVRSDGRDNFLGALIVASHYCIPEVTLYFHNRLYRGNRTIKVASNNFEAFASPNFEPLVTLAIDIRVNWSAIYRASALRKFGVMTNMCPDVGLLRLFPGISTAMVKAFLQPPLKGAVIQTYGSGNGPDGRKDLLDAFKEASDRSVLLLNITQCPEGGVSLTYGTGKALFDAGMISGFDMTAEAALAKLAYVLGKEEWASDKKRAMLHKNLRGEMKRSSKIETEQSIMDYPLFSAIVKSLNLTSSEEVSLLKKALLPTMINAASHQDDTRSLENIIKNGGSLAEQDYSGRTCLHVAATDGNSAMVEFLLKNGALLHVRDSRGNTPLDEAVFHCHDQVIGLLRQAGAHLLLPPVKLGLELCYAAACSNIQKLNAWILAGVDINLPDYTGQTALHVAIQHQFTTVVHFLLSHGANPLIQDQLGNSPISLAHDQNNQLMLQILKESCQSSKTLPTSSKNDSTLV